MKRTISKKIYSKRLLPLTNLSIEMERRQRTITSLLNEGLLSKKIKDSLPEISSCEKVTKVEVIKPIKCMEKVSNNKIELMSHLCNDKKIRLKNLHDSIKLIFKLTRDEKLKNKEKEIKGIGWKRRLQHLKLHSNKSCNASRISSIAKRCSLDLFDINNIKNHI